VAVRVPGERKEQVRRPGYRPRRGDYLQLHRPARLRPHPPGRHSGSGRPHATGKTDAVRWLNAIEAPRRSASLPELTIGPGTCKPPVPPPAPSPPRRQGEGPGRVGLWPVACAPAVEWTDCYERAPGRRGVTGPGPRTAQSRSARSGGGLSRLYPARVIPRPSQRRGVMTRHVALDHHGSHTRSLFSACRRLTRLVVNASQRRVPHVRLVMLSRILP
jgi:hypothetical protein